MQFSQHDDAQPYIEHRNHHHNIALIALGVALCIVLSFIEIPIFPIAPWLKFDPSLIACLAFALLYGWKSALPIAVGSWLPHCVVNPFGGIISMTITLACVIPAAIIYHSNYAKSMRYCGVAVGSLLAIAVGIGANLLIAPLLFGMSTQQVAAMIIPFLLPFNILKMGITATIVLLSFNTLQTIAMHITPQLVMHSASDHVTWKSNKL